MNESQRSGVTYPQLVRNEISNDGDGPQPHFFFFFLYFSTNPSQQPAARNPLFRFLLLLLLLLVLGVADNEHLENNPTTD